MTMSRRALCFSYGLIAVLALAGTWGNNLGYVGLGAAEATRQFWTDTFANPASRSITVDVLFLGLAVFVWMVLEARRLAMRGVWLYLVFGTLIAISAAVPLFLLHRERVLAAREPGSAGGRLGAVDAAGLVVIALLALGYAAATLMRPSAG